MMNSEGSLDPWLSPWFSCELTRTDCPWIFERGDKPSLIISTLEALAVLIGLKLFFGDDTKQGWTKVQVVPTWTDSRGNGSALNKLMSTKFPSSAVVMELSRYLKRVAAKASPEWVPRSTNYEAVALANSTTDSFDPSRRIVVEEKTLRWEILPEALSMGKQMEEDTENARASGIQQTEEGTQATKTGGQNERSVVRFSCQRLASALRLTGQLIVAPQFAACHGVNHASLILFMA